MEKLKPGDPIPGIKCSQCNGEICERVAVCSDCLRYFKAYSKIEEILGIEIAEQIDYRDAAEFADSIPPYLSTRLLIKQR